MKISEILKRILLTICVIALSFGVFAQDKQFSQFYSIPLSLSPSFTGATRQHRLSTAYRNQWIGLTGYVSYFLSYDHFFSKYNSGLGFSILRDYAGTARLGYMETALYYSYDINLQRNRLDGWHLRPGLSLSFSVPSLDFNKLVFPDQMSEQSVSGQTTETAPTSEPRRTFDASTSMLVYRKSFWTGVTVNHLLMPNQGFYYDKSRIALRYTVFGGGSLVRHRSLLKPIDESVLVAYMFRRQGDYNQLDLGVYWYKIPIIMGIWYRGIPVVNSPRGDALAALIGFKKQQFSFGYSYDFTISNLINVSKGSHEVSMSYQFTTSPRKRFRSLPCPDL